MWGIRVIPNCIKISPYLYLRQYWVPSARGGSPKLNIYLFVARQIDCIGVIFANIDWYRFILACEVEV
jgi:hypothetical protein